jgi:CII-binding regulator of phage lambda lysogenization HflD
MADSQGGRINENSATTEKKNEAYLEEEINIIDYFVVLWKRKTFIFLATVLPTLIVGVALFLWPRDYTISYLYNMGLDEKAFKVLEGMFYSGENIEKLVKKLHATGLEESAQKLAKAKTSQDLKKIVSFVISPAYFEDVKSSGANIEELQKIQEVRGTLLVMRVGANSEENIREIASIIRNNFEEIIPLYAEREDLNRNIITFKEKMASLEETKYTLNLQLERKRTTLEKLKKLVSERLDKLPGDNVVLQFNNIGDSSAYLPLPYQMQAAETQIVNLEEQIRADKELYDYYISLLKLDKKLFSYASKTMPPDYTLGQFCSFLTDTLAGYKDNAQVADYLNAYIKRIENKMANTMPLVEKPKVYPIAKGIVKKSGMVLAVSLMISVFAAFLREGLEKR